MNAIWSREPIRWSEGTANLFGIGRLKSLEPLFIDRSIYNKLVGAKDEAEFLRLLAETRYQKFMDQEALRYPALIFSRAEQEALNLSLEFAKERWFRYLLILPVYVFNLKLALKRQLAPAAPGEGLEEWKPALSAVVPPEVEASFSGIAARALTRAQQSQDPSVIDVLLDRAEAETALRISAGFDFAERYYRLSADLLNLRLLLRLKLLGESLSAPETVLVAGGSLPVRMLVGLESASVEEWKNRFSGTPFRELVQAGFDAFSGNGLFAVVERRSREILIEYINRARYVVLGYEPVFRFYRLWENELTNLRLIYSAKVAGLGPDICQELVADAD
ncbi:MAG: V-type ATPase subunit [candidate division WOR-3 bacterium]|jgi:vacuolar-type H+-ATPase subunit C/Vma6